MSSKINSETGTIDETSVSLAALRKSPPGHEVIGVMNDRSCRLFEVVSITGFPGLKGFSRIVLRESVTQDVVTFDVKNSIPDGYVRFRRVTMGTNAQTLKKLAPVVKEKVFVAQPAMEDFTMNILDLPTENGTENEETYTEETIEETHTVE
jgi:hypothetical protein